MKTFAIPAVVLSLVACSSTPPTAPEHSPATLQVDDAPAPAALETRETYVVEAWVELASHDARIDDLKRRALLSGDAAVEAFTDHQADLILLRERAENELRRLGLDTSESWREARPGVEAALEALEDELAAATTAILSA